MIVFDLVCRSDDTRFEGWFRSSADFDRQSEGGLLMCPVCGGNDIGKAVMAPAVGRKGNQIATAATRTESLAEPAGDQQMTAAAPLSPEVKKALGTLAEIQKQVLAQSRWVGGKFAEEARAIHYGEREEEPIHGQTTREEAEELREEGIDVAPLPFPVAPPDAVN